MHVFVLSSCKKYKTFKKYKSSFTFRWDQKVTEKNIRVTLLRKYSRGQYPRQYKTGNLKFNFLRGLWNYFNFIDVGLWTEILISSGPCPSCCNPFRLIWTPNMDVGFKFEVGERSFRWKAPLQMRINFFPKKITALLQVSFNWLKLLCWAL